MGATPAPSTSDIEAQVTNWTNVAGSITQTILALTGQVGIASLVPLFEHLVNAAMSGLEAAKGVPITPDTVEKLRSTIKLVPPSS